VSPTSEVTRTFSAEAAAVGRLDLEKLLRDKVRRYFGHLRCEIEIDATEIVTDGRVEGYYGTVGAREYTRW
jgi:hypothetical protein